MFENCPRYGTTTSGAYSVGARLGSPASEMLGIDPHSKSLHDKLP